ncbi:MAG: phosphate ABC transporter substrate-binding protein [Vicinamibacterales bacterium]
MFSAKRLLTLGVSLGALMSAACSGSSSTTTSAPAETAASGVVIRLTGSDTMVNLNQAWAENYKKIKPDVSIQVAGGGSGVGIAGLIDETLDIAASSREIEPAELEKATTAANAAPQEYVMGLDALAVYVHEGNPLKSLSIEELAEIYGDGGQTLKWSQLGVKNAACSSDEIIRVSRQNNSGTYAYFREAILGRTREFKLGSIDQSGSKDVVALVSKTPCAIGYSGMAYAMPGVHTLNISKKKGEPGVAPTLETALDNTYPIARPLYFYTHGTPSAATKEFIDWTLSPAGQQVLKDIGYVPAPAK